MQERKSKIEWASEQAKEKRRKRHKHILTHFIRSSLIRRANDCELYETKKKTFRQINSSLRFILLYVSSSKRLHRFVFISFFVFFGFILIAVLFSVLAVCFRICCHFYSGFIYTYIHAHRQKLIQIYIAAPSEPHQYTCNTRRRLMSFTFVHLFGSLLCSLNRPYYHTHHTYWHKLIHSLSRSLVFHVNKTAHSMTIFSIRTRLYRLCLYTYIAKIHMNLCVLAVRFFLSFSISLIAILSAFLLIQIEWISMCHFFTLSFLFPSYFFVFSVPFSLSPSLSHTLSKTLHTRTRWPICACIKFIRIYPKFLFSFPPSSLQIKSGSFSINFLHVNLISRY